jgi:cholesterol transport system auxiliary component
MGYDAQLQAVVVRYDAVVEEQGGAVRSRRFEASVPGIAAEAATIGPALNRAANEVAKAAAAWIVTG